MSDAVQYGIPDIRDAHGNLKGVEHTYAWGQYNGIERDKITIEHIPLTEPEQREIEAAGREIEEEQIAELLADKMVKPEPPTDGEWAYAEMMCYFEGIIDFATGGGGQLMQQAREELDRRHNAADEEGN